MTNTKQHVTVIGLGAMGRALAGAFLEAGHPTTVFNRSPGKADELVGRGARRAESVTEALEAGELTVVCVLSYGIARKLLEPAADALAGRTIVHLSHGSPADARELSGWVADHGGAYVDGGIMSVPQTIGQPGSFIVVAGAEEAIERTRSAIAVLGDPIDVGRDPGLAPLHDIALLSGLYGIAAGAQLAVSLIDSGGGDVELFRGTLLLPWMEAMLPFTAGVVNTEGTMPDEFNATMQAAVLESMIASSRAAGVEEALTGHLHASLALMRADAA